jgi:hypothetical protein
MTGIPLDSAAWDWGAVERRKATLHGRDCLALDGIGSVLADVELADGTIELDLAVAAERSFQGIVWRGDGVSFESFFVRPHRVGNPDAIQYTPAFHGVSSWQLYHGDGFWALVAFPVEEWFTIRVTFAGSRAEMFVGDLETPALVSTLRLEPGPGRFGLSVGGPGLRVSRLEHSDEASFVTQPREPEPTHPGVVRAWEVSEAFAEREVDAVLTAGHEWTSIEAEPSGLLDLARVQGIDGERNTVLARATIHSARGETQPLEVGFSDRAVVYLDGRPLFRGDDGYRSRDYRFLGSIGWHDTVFLPLREGDNELVVAVSEDFGGWGVQARLAG